MSHSLRQNRLKLRSTAGEMKVPMPSLGAHDPRNHSAWLFGQEFQTAFQAGADARRIAVLAGNALALTGIQGLSRKPAEVLRRKKDDLAEGKARLAVPERRIPNVNTTPN